MMVPRFEREADPAPLIPAPLSFEPALQELQRKELVTDLLFAVPARPFSPCLVEGRGGDALPRLGAVGEKIADRVLQGQIITGCLPHRPAGGGPAPLVFEAALHEPGQDARSLRPQLVAER